MTDKPKDEAASAIVTTEKTPEDLEELGKGNNIYLPSFESTALNQTSSKNVQQPSNPEDSKSAPEKDEKMGDIEGGSDGGGGGGPHMVMHKGALIDIDKLLQQLNRSEKAREETEIRLCELNRTHSELQSSNSKNKDKIKDLQSELKSSHRKMSDVESSLSSTNVSLQCFHSLNNDYKDVSVE